MDKFIHMTVDELIKLYREGNLITDQSTQRNFIYNTIDADESGTISKAGDVIRSIIEDDIQLPALYFWSVQDDEKGIHYPENKFNIHDGKQRFLSIYYFLNPVPGITVTTNINGIDVTKNNLTEEQLLKLKSTELGIVVRYGTEAQEEKSFYKLNTTGEPLKPYEALRGAYHGTYIYEFENYLIRLLNEGVDGIDKIGRGEQAFWFLCLALLDADVLKDKNQKTLIEAVKSKLAECRENSFDKNYHHFEDKIYFYSDLNRVLKQGKSRSDGHGLQKLMYIVSWVVSAQLDQNKVLTYFRESLRATNDISGWGIQEYTTAINNICNRNIACYPVRNFDKSVRDILYSRSNKCHICGKAVALSDINIDHIIAWSEGGPTTLDNAKLAHKKCNCSRGNRVWEA